jgi:hypothetical protein
MTTTTELNDSKVNLFLSIALSGTFLWYAQDNLTSMIADVAKSCLNDSTSPPAFFSPCVVSTGITTSYALVLLAAIGSTVYFGCDLHQKITLLSNAEGAKHRCNNVVSDI